MFEGMDTAARRIDLLNRTSPFLENRLSPDTQIQQGLLPSATRSIPDNAATTTLYSLPIVVFPLDFLQVFRIINPLFDFLM
jgi:hypothetical protein